MLTVIADEPLRESAHGLLIEIHLSEGNTSEALRQFEICAELLWRELDVAGTGDEVLLEFCGAERRPVPGGIQHPHQSVQWLKARDARDAPEEPSAALIGRQRRSALERAP